MTHLGFPYPAIDPLAFLVDDEIRPFQIDIRHDLTGTGAQACPTLSNGLFIVHDHVVPDNTAEVIMGVFPHVWERTNVGLVTASVKLLDFRDVAGWVLFDSTKDNNQPFLVQNNYNKPTIAAAPNDLDRDTERGSTFLSDDAPIIENIGMRNPLSTIYLPAKSLFRVLFSLTPAAPPPNNIPNPYQIGVGPKRIDFAGALVFGLRMPQQTYDQLKIARRNGQLGPEGSSVVSPIGTAKR
jgi:hypothetical protein